MSRPGLAFSSWKLQAATGGKSRFRVGQDGGREESANLQRLNEPRGDRGPEDLKPDRSIGRGQRRSVAVAGHRACNLACLTTNLKY